MTEIEMREAIRGLANIVKVQAEYIRYLHDGMAVLFEALEKDPGLEASILAAKKALRVLPTADELIQNSVAIVQQLERR